jgi:hypothetical protein
MVLTNTGISVSRTSESLRAELCTSHLQIFSSGSAQGARVQQGDPINFASKMNAACVGATPSCQCSTWLGHLNPLASVLHIFYIATEPSALSVTLLVRGHARIALYQSGIFPKKKKRTHAIDRSEENFRLINATMRNTCDFLPH